MPVKVYSCMVQGITGKLVEVEADILRGMPSFKIVGLGDTAVQESKERIRSAIKNSGAVYPQQKKIINLAPANMHKAGPQFDLPIALSVLAASSQIKIPSDAIFLGELALNGEIKPVRGIISACIFAGESGYSKLFIPEGNAGEALMVKGPDIYPLKSLREIISHLQGKKEIQIYSGKDEIFSEYSSADTLSEIIGQEKAKRALQIAAAGHHHIVFSGPCGVGKTLLARALPSLLPPLLHKEAIEVMQIRSAKGIPGGPQMARPFREVHSRTSLASLTGGGNPLQPGEISLAHEGVLFMDEISEFPRTHIETLRKPLEEGKITFLRNSESISFPAKFMLVAAMNPCPCGYFGDPKKECRCRPHQIANYSKKLSGPVLDRIDLFTEVPRQHLGKAAPKYSSDNFRESILTAKKIQSQRFKNLQISANSRMGLREITKFCPLDKSSQKMLNTAAEQFQLSGRQYHKIIKVARTIADLSQKTHITEEHIAEALQYRPDKHYNASV